MGRYVGWGILTHNLVKIARARVLGRIERRRISVTTNAKDNRERHILCYEFRTKN